MADETVKTRKKREPRAKVAPGVPVILAFSPPKSFKKLQVVCEAADALTYRDYVRYVAEKQPTPKQLTEDEIEIKFNSMAWFGIWNKDEGFKAWQRARMESE